MKNRFDISGKVAVVTGGSRGVGKAIAVGLAEQGAQVAIIATRPCDAVVREIEALPGSAKSYAFDLADFAGYNALVAQIAADFGGIDILVNNAGVQRRHPAVEFPEDDWDFVMDINCKAVFRLCQKAGRLMLDKEYGKIINLASLLSFQGGVTVPAYTASKSAVMGVTKALSNEWARQGVNVNGIAPGYIATDMNEALLADENRNRQILERIPAGRWGTPEDLVGAALFLASPASDYLHGHTIVVDGGWLGR